MISKLRGLVWDLNPPFVCLEVNGCGYELQMPLNAFLELQRQGESPIEIWVHHQFREDGQALYGFLKAEEKKLFKAIIKVKGVGPKIALAILSHYEPTQFFECMAQKNTMALSKIPGIGQKTAERLMVELKDLQPKSAFLSAIPVFPKTSLQSPFSGQGLPSNQAQHETIAALLSLGYKIHEAETALHRVLSLPEYTELPETSVSSNVLIKQALKMLSKI